MSEDKIGEILEQSKDQIQNSLKAVNERVLKEFQQLKSLTSAVSAEEKSMQPAPLLAAFREIAATSTQADTLRLLVSHVATYAPRTLLLIKKSGNVHGWAGDGFSPEFMRSGLKKVVWPVTSYPELNAVVSDRHALVRNFNEIGDLADKIAGFDGFQPFKSCFFPLIVKNKVAGIIYIDSGSEPQLNNQEVVEMLCYVAGLELTMITAKLKQVEKREQGSSQRSSAKPVAAATNQRAEPTFDPPPPSEFTSQKVAAAEFDTTGSGESENPGVKKAKRVARVLVSDLKLYNEEAVSAGRKNHDLYNRLRDDIDRSFRHYEERVAGLVANSDTNYFKEEIIRQLGDGDPKQVGPLPF